MLSIPSRRAVPGAIISRALIKPGSGLTSLSKSSPDLGATVLHSRAFSLPLAPPTPARRALRPGARGSRGARRTPLLSGQRLGQRLEQRRRLARLAATVLGGDHAAAAVLEGLFQAPLWVTHPAQLARQAELAEARPRRGWVGTQNWHPPAGAGHRQGHRQ